LNTAHLSSKKKEIRLDGLLTPISENFDLPLVFLEAQMQGNSEFYSRYFSGLFLVPDKFVSIVK
jgi:predicted transposase YdaD